MIGEIWQSEAVMRTPQLISALLAATLAAVPLQAQEKKPTAEKHDAQALANALRDVINTGADLFNMHGDYAGCYRVYQGGLLSIKPFLTPDLQKKIDEGIAKAERLPRFSDRAFELRGVIDEIRAQSKGGAPAPAKKDESMKTTAADPNAGSLGGVVTYNGQPAPPGFITLVGSDKRRFSASITEGKYKFKTPIPPGTFRIAIERVPDAKIPANLDIPERYRNEGTSGLTVEVRAGKMNLDLQLVK
jgi:hypothetical protein